MALDGPDREPDGRPGAVACPRARGSCCWPRSCSDRKGEYLQRARGAARPGLRARADRRRGLRAGRPAEAGPAQEAHHRGRRRPLPGAAPTCSSAWPSPSRPRSASPTACAAASIVACDDAGRREELALLRPLRLPDLRLQHPELEPRLFSFNNPAGACPTCDGLGVKQFFDPDARGRATRELSLADGAVRGWDRRNAYYFQMLQCARASTTASTSRPPGRSCRAKIRRSCSTAAARRRSSSSYLNGRGGTRQAQAPVRGHHPEPGAPLPRDRVQHGARGAGASYLEHQPCPACEGTRLNRGRAPRVRRQAHPAAVTRLSVGDALGVLR